MKQLYELFDEFEMAIINEDEAGAIEILRRGGYPMKEVLRGTFHPGAIFVFDEPVLYNYAAMPAGMGYSTIHKELGRAYLFIKDHPDVSPNLTFQRKKELLIQTLEALEPQEADIYMNMMLKRTDVEGLTYEIAKKAFPEINLP